MFNSEIKIYGKHANYIRFLSAKGADNTKAEVKNASVFSRHIDVYIAGAIIGLVKKLKSLPDKTDTPPATIFADAVIREQLKLKFLYHLALIIDDANVSSDEAADRAFRYDNDEEKVKEGMELFNNYVRGGIEWLYEAFTDKALSYEDYMDKIYSVVRDFAETYYGEDTIDKFLGGENE